MKTKLSDLDVKVFVDPDTTNDHESFSGYSFKSDMVETMKYPEFLSRMSAQATGMTARSKSEHGTNLIERDIVYPKFYHEFGEFEGIELTQG